MKILPLPALGDNYIWTIAHEDRCFVVDPGDARPVLDHLALSGHRLAAILLTHQHADHRAGALELAQKTGARVFGPASPLMPEVSDPVSEGDEFDLLGLNTHIQVLAVPGHTPEHIAYLVGNALFCGDTLFGAGCGRLLGGTAEELHASLARIAHLPADTLIYSAHEYTLANLRFAQSVEPDNHWIAERLACCERIRLKGQPSLPSVLTEELETNPFLRAAIPAVREACEAWAGHPLENEQAVFKALRAWKDVF